MVKQGLTPPRIASPRPKGAHLGKVMAEVADGLGFEWYPWQRYVGDASTALVKRRGNERMRLRAGNVGVLVSRQVGKSVWARTRGWTQCLLPELIDVEQVVGGKVGPQHVGWLCQDRANAIRSWNDAVDSLMESPYYDAVRKITRQRGDESVVFGNGSYLRVVTPSRTGPRGLDLDLIILDEALAHPSELLAALAPTQAARDSNRRSIGAQLVVLSSEGDERSSLLATIREVGRRAVAEGDPSRAWFEWSASVEADVYDPAVWKAAIPTLDRPGGISTEFVRMQSETMAIEDFRREYLCLHTPRPAQYAVDVEAWEAAPYGVPSGEVVFSIDCTPSGDAASIVAVAPHDVGHVVELVEARAGIDWLTSSVVEKAKRWNAPVVLDGGGPCGWIVPSLTDADVDVVRIKGGDAFAAASRFATLVAQGAVAHQDDARLVAAIKSATRRRSGDRWGFDRNSGDVSSLVAAALGVWAIETTDALAGVQVW